MTLYPYNITQKTFIRERYQWLADFNFDRDTRPMHLKGTPPYIVTQIYQEQPMFGYGYYLIAYISASNPVPMTTYMHKYIIELGSKNPSNDLLLNYDGEIVLEKDFKAVVNYYTFFLQQQINDLINGLNFDSVKLDQQDQFYRGLKLFKVSPTIALQICLDAYNFDGLEVNWSNPVTYLNAVKEIMGLAKGVISIASAF